MPSRSICLVGKPLKDCTDLTLAVRLLDARLLGSVGQLA